MKNLEIFKEFLIRNKNVWNKIKLNICSSLLNEEKRLLQKVQNDLTLNKATKSTFISKGEDTFQQNVLDIANEDYTERISNGRKEIEKFEQVIVRLENYLGFRHNLPIQPDNLFSERKPKVEWVFNRLSQKEDFYKSTLLDSIRVQVFGELINSLNQETKKIEKNLNFYQNHLSDYQIAIGIKKPVEIPEEHKELFQQVEKDLEEMVNWGLADTNDLSLLKPQSIEQLKGWYSVKLSDEDGTEKLGQIIDERILLIQMSLDDINNKKKNYLALVENFSNEEIKSEWIKEWINIEIPNEIDELF